MQAVNSGHKVERASGEAPPKGKTVKKASIPPAHKTDDTPMISFMLNGCGADSQGKRRHEAEESLKLFEEYEHAQLKSMLPDEEAEAIDSLKKAVDADDTITSANLSAVTKIAKKYDPLSLERRAAASESLQTTWSSMKLNEIEWKGMDTVKLVTDNKGWHENLYLKELIGHFSKKSLKYSVETSWVFSTNIVQGEGEKHSMLELLVHKGIIKEADLELLIKFKGAAFLTRQELDQLKQNYQNILAPLACASHEATYELIKIKLEKEERSFCKTFQMNPFEITAEKLKKLKVIADEHSETIEAKVLAKMEKREKGPAVTATKNQGSSSVINNNNNNSSVIAAEPPKKPVKPPKAAETANPPMQVETPAEPPKKPVKPPKLVAAAETAEPPMAPAKPPKPAAKTPDPITSTTTTASTPQLTQAEKIEALEMIRAEAERVHFQTIGEMMKAKKKSSPSGVEPVL